MHVKVIGNTQDDFIRALKIFSKKVKEAGIIQEIHRRKEYTKPSIKKRRKREDAIKRRIRDERSNKNI